VLRYQPPEAGVGRVGRARLLSLFVVTPPLFLSLGIATLSQCLESASAYIDEVSMYWPTSYPTANTVFLEF
jgi:hypothetical protein